MTRSQAPRGTQDELIELQAAARAAGGQALTEPKLEHFCIAFCRTRRAERRAAAAPARRAHPSRCARHSNPRPAAGSERRPHTRESRRAARAPQPQAARMPSLHITDLPSVVPQVSSSSRTRSSGVGDVGSTLRVLPWGRASPAGVIHHRLGGRAADDGAAAPPAGCRGRWRGGGGSGGCGAGQWRRGAGLKRSKTPNV